MNRLVGKLLRKHLSVAQIVGFFLANLLGMCIVLVSWQFYADVSPVFTQGDSFMKKTYMVVGKRVTAAQTFRGTTPHFSASEIADFQKQPFVRSLGEFVPAQFDVYASIGSPEIGVGFSTEMFFESIPDEYVDADLSRWNYIQGSDSLPIILPRNYLNLYNFGFASTRGLPALSEGLVGMVNLHFRLRGPAGQRMMNGKVVGFSDRLNTILVPQNFMEMANAELSPDRLPVASRLILDVRQPADDRIASYLVANGYEEEGNAADAGRMTYFLRMIVGIVLAVGLVICALSFYVLLLSIFLLLQKHTEKIDTLLLIGYKTSDVAFPFHLLSLTLNGFVLILSLGLVWAVRGYYVPMIGEIYPKFEPASMCSTVLLGFLLFVLVALLNYGAITRRILKVWYIHRQ